jgi:hypothetical protein
MKVIPMIALAIAGNAAAAFAEDVVPYAYDLGGQMTRMRRPWATSWRQRNFGIQNCGTLAKSAIGNWPAMNSGRSETASSTLLDFIATFPSMKS